MPYQTVPSRPPLWLSPYLRLSRVQYRSSLDGDQGVRLSGKQQEVVDTKENFHETLWEGEKQAPCRAGTNGGHTVRAQPDYYLSIIWPECCHGMPDNVLLQAHLCCWGQLRKLYLSLCLYVCASAWLSSSTCSHPGCPLCFTEFGIVPQWEGY